MLPGKLGWIVLALSCSMGSRAEEVGPSGNGLEEPAPWVVDAETRKREFVRLPSKSERALEDAAKWLLAHQDEDGRWSSAGFARHCKGKHPCDGPGQPEQDIGVTGLASLTLMAVADMSGEGEERTAVERGLRWLVKQQAAEEGLIGEKIGHSYLYGHAIATTALAEGLLVLGMEELRPPLEKAVRCIVLARNPSGVWRYDLPPTGDNDTSITAWMVSALATARDAGIADDAESFSAAIRWIDEVMDRETGRVGYDSTGSASSRVPGVNDHYPTDRAEAMTGAGLVVRFLCGQHPEREPFMRKQAQLLLKHLPEWADEGLTNDLYAWYYGTSAMHQLGGADWRAWSKALVPALTSGQERRGEAKGSWPPIGPWCFSGGRVYSTAMAALALAAPVRHRQLVVGD